MREQGLKVVTVEQMQAIETAANARGLSYATMMENAGRAVAKWLERQGVQGQAILTLVGPGNNGGDGLVAARCLQQAGASVSVYCVQRKAERDANWILAQEAGIPLHRFDQDSDKAQLRRLVGSAHWIVDAVLGTGISRPIGGALQETLVTVRDEVKRRRTSATEAFTSALPPVEPRGQPMPRILAIDVPSGLDCNTGAVDPATIPADVTIALAFPKLGHFLFPGADYVGRLVVADIGVPEALAHDIQLEMVTPSRVQSLLPNRPKDSHKGTFGKVMVVAGSANYTGAPYLAARAAMRVGAGLVTLALPELLHPILSSTLTEATYLVLPHEMGALVPEAVKVLREGLSGYQALLVGPGLGRDEKTVEFVARLLALPPAEKRGRLGFVERGQISGDVGSRLPPLVIDADALNALSGIRDWQHSLARPAVLTPHPGEMSRLLQTTVGEVETHRITTASRAAQDWGVVVTLKGPYTIIAAPDGRTCINPFATPALATAGTGDVLAGAIAGLLAQGLAPFEAALVGAYLHGLAGQMVSEEVGTAGAVAGDLLERLPMCLSRVALAGMLDNL